MKNKREAILADPDRYRQEQISGKGALHIAVDIGVQQFQEEAEARTMTFGFS